MPTCQQTAPRAYRLRTRFLVLRDHPGHPPRIERLEWLVDVGRYFTSLATTLELLEEELAANRQRGEAPRAETVELLKNLRGDLAYLQNHYQIGRK